MKKLLLAVGLITLCGGQAAIAQSKPAETKASMLKSIRGRLVKEMISDGTPKEQSEQFGDCFTKDLGTKLTLEEIRVFYKLSSLKPGQTPPKALLDQAKKMGLEDKMENVGKDCGSLLQ